jgi:hypothetical protein
LDEASSEPFGAPFGPFHKLFNKLLRRKLNGTRHLTSFYSFLVIRLHSSSYPLAHPSAVQRENGLRTSNAQHSMDFLLLQKRGGGLDGFVSQKRDVSYSQPLTLISKPLPLCWLLEFNV